MGAPCCRCCREAERTYTDPGSDQTHDIKNNRPIVWKKPVASYSPRNSFNQTTKKKNMFKLVKREEM